MTEISEYNQNTRNTPPEYQVSNVLPSVNTFSDPAVSHQTHNLRSNGVGLLGTQPSESNYPSGFNIQVITRVN